MTYIDLDKRWWLIQGDADEQFYGNAFFYAGWLLGVVDLVWSNIVFLLCFRVGFIKCDMFGHTSPLLLLYKLDANFMATTNLVGNLDNAFDRRFLIGW